MAVGLLVSVRSAEEAEAAVAGGADLVDVKEPTRGALGRADDVTIAAVVRAVACRRPTSAALGELVDGVGSIPDGVAFVKWGLAGCRAWRVSLDAARARCERATPVIVAYADATCAGAPPFTDVVSYAAETPGQTLLVDTHCKEPDRRGRRPTLFDWLSEPELADAIARMRAVGGRVALAGSLGPDDVGRAAALGPDWVAVRGAACAAGDRRGAVTLDGVRALKERLAPHAD